MSIVWLCDSHSGFPDRIGLYRRVPSIVMLRSRPNCISEAWGICMQGEGYVAEMQLRVGNGNNDH